MLIEARVIAYLTANLQGVDVKGEVPEDFPDDGALVIVEKVGESVSNHLRRARLAVQSYGDTLLHAGERNEAVLAALESLPAASPAVSSCRVETSYNFTDEVRKRYRYQAIVHVSYYEEG